jgi:hypothetical protein
MVLIWSFILAHQINIVYIDIYNLAIHHMTFVHVIWCHTMLKSKLARLKT